MLEKILKGFGRKAVAAGLIASLFFGCSKDNPVNSPAKPSPPAVQNHAPVVSSSPITSVNENQFYNYQPKATDADGDKLKYLMTKGPSWLSINSSTGLISGTAPEVSADEVNNVEWSVSDGKASSSQKYPLTVKNLANTYVLTENQLGTLVKVDSTSLSFSQPMNFAAGDIVAAGISQQTPDGLLRKINSMSSDRRIAYAGQATLAEAIKDGDISFSGNISAEGASLNKFGNGIRISSSESGRDFIINFDNTIIYDFDGNPSTKDKLIANGNISFGLGYNFSHKARNSSLEELIFTFTASEKFDIKINSLGAFGGFNKNIQLKEFSLSPFIMGYTPTVPPIPVIVKPKIAINLGFFGGIKILETAVYQEAEATLGLKYSNGVWTPIHDLTHKFNVDPFNTDGQKLYFKVSLGPKIKFPLYGIAGPNGEFSGNLSLEVNPQKWVISGGLDLKAGVEAKLFGKGLLDYSATIWTYKVPLMEGQTIQAPPDTLIIQPGPEGKDAHVRHVLLPDGTESNEGFGDNPLLEIEYEHISNHAVDQEGLLEFPLSLPKDSKISSAKLRVYGYATTNSLHDKPTIKLSKLLDSWQEANVKWNTKPSESTISSKDFVNEGASSWYEFDVTSAVQSWFAGESNYGFGLSTSENEVHGAVYSSDNPDAAKRPRLEILYNK
jgi:hypothetical protein